MRPHQALAPSFIVLSFEIGFHYVAKAGQGLAQSLNLSVVRLHVLWQHAQLLPLISIETMFRGCREEGWTVRSVYCSSRGLKLSPPPRSAAWGMLLTPVPAYRMPPPGFCGHLNAHRYSSKSLPPQRISFSPSTTGLQGWICFSGLAASAFSLQNHLLCTDGHFKQCFFEASPTISLQTKKKTDLLVLRTPSLFGGALLGFRGLSFLTSTPQKQMVRDLQRCFKGEQGSSGNSCLPMELKALWVWEALTPGAAQPLGLCRSLSSRIESWFQNVLPWFIMKSIESSI